MKRKYEYNPEREYDPELDFTSERFNSVKALEFDIPLPYPKAKQYDNIADWFSHTFGKKNQNESKASSKNDLFILKRNYRWYYNTLGLYVPYHFDEGRLIMKEFKQRRDQYGNFKKVNVKEVDPAFLEPLRSSKIIIKRPDGSVQKYIYLNREDKTNDEVLSKNNDINEIETSISFEGNPFSSNEDFSISKKCENDSEMSTNCNSVLKTSRCNITRKLRKALSKSVETNKSLPCNKQKELSQVETNSLSIRKNILKVENNLALPHNSTNLNSTSQLVPQHYFHSSENMKVFLLKCIENCSSDNFKDPAKLSLNKTPDYQIRPVVAEPSSKKKYALEKTTKNNFDVESEMPINLNQTLNSAAGGEYYVDKTKKLSNNNIGFFISKIFDSSESSSDAMLSSVSNLVSEKPNKNKEAAEIKSNSESVIHQYNSGEIIDQKYSETSVNYMSDQSHATADKNNYTFRKSREYNAKSTTENISEGKPTFLQTYKIPKKVGKFSSSDLMHNSIHRHNSLIKNHDKCMQDKPFNRNGKCFDAKRNFEGKTVFKEISNKNDVKKADRNVNSIFKRKDSLRVTSNQTSEIKISKYSGKLTTKRISEEKIAFLESDNKRRNVEMHSNSSKKGDKLMQGKSYDDDDDWYIAKRNFRERAVHKKVVDDKNFVKKSDRNCNSSSKTRDSLCTTFNKTGKNYEKLTTKCIADEKATLVESDSKEKNVERSNCSNSAYNTFHKNHSSNKNDDRLMLDKPLNANEKHLFKNENFEEKVLLKEIPSKRSNDCKAEISSSEHNHNSSFKTKDSFCFTTDKNAEGTELNKSDKKLPTKKNYEEKNICASERKRKTLEEYRSSKSLLNLNHKINSLNKYDEKHDKAFGVNIKQNKPFNAKSDSKERDVLKDIPENRKDVSKSDVSVNSNLITSGTSYKNEQSYSSSFFETSNKKLSIKTSINLEMLKEVPVNRTNSKEVKTENVEKKKEEPKLCDQKYEMKYSLTEDIEIVKDKKISVSEISSDSKLNTNNIIDMASQDKKYEKESEALSVAMPETDSKSVSDVNSSGDIKNKTNSISTQEKFLDKKSFPEEISGIKGTLDNESPAEDKINEENSEVSVTYMSTAQNSSVPNQEEKDILFKNKKSRKTRSYELQRRSSSGKFLSHKEATLEMENLPKNKYIINSYSDIEKNSPKSIVCSDDNSSPERKTRCTESQIKLSDVKFLSHKKSSLEMENLSKAKDIKNSDSGIEMNSPKSIILSDDSSSPERKKTLRDENLKNKFSNCQEKMSDINFKSQRRRSFRKSDEKQKHLELSPMNSTLKHKVKDSYDGRSNSKRRKRSVPQRTPSLELSSNYKIRFGESGENKEHTEVSENSASSRLSLMPTNNCDVDNTKTELFSYTESEYKKENKPATVVRNSSSDSNSVEVVVLLDTAINRKDVKEVLSDSGSVLKSVENSNCGITSKRKIGLNESYEIATKNTSNILDKSSDSIKSTDSDKEMSLLDLARKARNKVRKMISD